MTRLAPFVVKLLNPGLASLGVGLVVLAITQSMAGAVSAGAANLTVFLVFERWRRHACRETVQALEAALRRLKQLADPQEFFPATQASPRLEDLASQVYEQAIELEKGLLSQAEKQLELEESRGLLESVLRSMGDGVIVVAGDGRVIFVNAVARALLGSPTSEPKGRPLMELARSPELQNIFEVTLSSGRQLRKEVTLKRRKAVLDVVATRLPGAPKAGCVILMHNVTELRQLEQTRREFVSNVSHELKTPLTAIQAYADTLLEGGLDDIDNRSTFVTRIVEQADRLQELIQDMLRLARIESQQEAFDLRRVNVGDVVRESALSREAVAAARQVQLIRCDDSGEGEVIADHSGLRTIVDNLISNAINYTPEGGRVEVRWRKSAGEVLIEVADNGVGIAAEHQARVFERFYRVERARSRSGGGTGLGLAIVKHLTAVFGGTVELESEVGKGSLFRVRLPAA